MISFSIITCTYNPDMRLLKRTMEAVQVLQKESLDFEYIIVDNNSTTPISVLNFVKSFIAQNKWAKLIVENKSGLSNARIAGFLQSSNEHIVFFDDDNEPAADYLVKLKLAIQKNPKAGIIGPGNISVDYIDGKPCWTNEDIRFYYQERHFKNPIFDIDPSWKFFYPTGSGMYVRKSIFSKYMDIHNSGNLSFTGRFGNSLTSCDDAQIIWTSIKEGHQVGTEPDLFLNHIIPSKRTTKSYLKNLNYSIARDTPLAYNEIFAHTKKRKLFRILYDYVYNIINIFKYIIINIFNIKKLNLLSLKMASLNGGLIGNLKLWMIKKG